ncbi:MAG: hypothetical protein J3K34DRAFT_508325 [Monoraphidium minutum]|nr:MAG: hypothetical protein J3K34DRAFT_508325 [Monoraphidium minutum]
MGKKTKAAPKAPTAQLSDEAAARVAALKDAGNKAFTKRDYAGALEQYEAAAKLLPEAAGGRADLLCNRAACFFQMKRFKDAARECTAALTAAPGMAKALQRRARSLEMQGLYKAALSDIQAVNRTPAATDESREAERRLRDTLAGRRPASPAGAASAVVPAPAAANGAAARGAAAPNAQAAAAAAAAQRGQLFAVSAKVSLGDETRQLHLTSASTYAQLLDLVKAKFPDAGPFMVKYTDRDGDAITITSRADVRAAVADMVQSTAQPKGGVAPLAPALKLTLVPCKEPEVPQPPREEREQAEALRRSQEAAAARVAAARREADREAAAAAGAAAAAAAPLVGTTPAGEVVEIDDWLIDFANLFRWGLGEVVEIDHWLIDFANLFRDVSGLDPDGHVEFQNEGWDATTRAMEATLRSDGAAPLFEAAAERFRDVTCTGLLNWGNVSVCIAHKLLDDVGEAGGELGDDAAKQAEAAFDKAEAEAAFDKTEARYKEALAFFTPTALMARYKEALAFYPDYFDGLAALGQLEVERAKVRARLAVKPTPPAAPPPPGASASEKAAADAAAAAAAEALRGALAKVKKADVEAAGPHMARAGEWYAKAVAAAEAADARRKAEGAARAAARAARGEGGAEQQQQQGGEGEGGEGATFAAQTRIMEGNALYEWSQVLAAAGLAWRPTLDAAAARFTAAACTPADLRAALKNHTRAAELDLGPEPEAEAAAGADAKAGGADNKGGGGGGGAKEEEKPKAKGLPGLQRKK